MFKLHPRLAADTLPICQLSLTEVRLMNDRRFCWCILIPQRPDKSGVHELTNDDQQTLIQESSLVSKALNHLFKPERINIGALGNMVPQLHWHVVARHPKDPCWPGPVWGCGQTTPYDESQITETVELLRRQVTRLAAE